MANKQPSTTDLIPIRDIRDGVIILKDNSLRGVVQVNAINFELRSSDEQVAILQQFAAFLNSIDFPIQMIVESRRFDIGDYLETVRVATEQLANELLKSQATEYMRFVGELAELSNIMAKNFYVAIPFVVASVKEGRGIMQNLKDIFKKKPAQQMFSPEQLASYKSQLQQRANLIVGGLSGMGLSGHMLNQEELTKLFTNLFNPVVPESKPQT